MSWSILTALPPSSGTTWILNPLNLRLMAFRPTKRPDDPFWRTNEGDEESPEALAAFVNPKKGSISSASEGHSIPTEGRGIVSGESFDKGDLVQKDGSGDLQELSAITDKVYGAALEPVSNGAAQGVVTDTVLVARAKFVDDPNTGRDLPDVKPLFAVTDVNGTSPTSSHVGTKCALSLSSGEWEIDISNTGNQDVEVIEINPVRDEFLVQFLDSVIQS